MENSKLEESLRLLKKELVVTRIFCIISSILAIVLLSGGIWVYVQMKPVFQVVEKTGPVIEELSELDTESLDTEELSKAIERLNSVIDTLESWGEKLGSIKGLFG